MKSIAVVNKDAVERVNTIYNLSNNVLPALDVVKEYFPTDFASQVYLFNQYLNKTKITYAITTPVVKITSKSKGYQVEVSSDVVCDSDAISVSSKLDFYIEDDIPQLTSLSSTKAVDLLSGLQKVRAELQELFINELTLVINKQALNSFLESNSPESSNYIVQFEERTNSNVFSELSQSKVTWLVEERFLTNLHITEFWSSLTRSMDDTLSKLYNYVNVVDYIYYGSHELYSGYLTVDVSKPTLRNFQTLLKKTAKPLDETKSQHADILYKVEDNIAKVYNKVLGNKVDRAVERFYVKTLEFDINTLELHKLTNLYETYQSTKDGLILINGGV